MHSDFFVTTDTKGSDGVTGFGSDGCLTGELFKHFGGSGEAITGFADGDV